MHFDVAIKTLAALVVLALLGFVFYLLPPINERLSWRLDAAMAYVRGVLNPAGDLPTPIVTEELPPTPSPSPTPSPAPTPAGLPSPTTVPSPTPLPPSVILPAPKWEKQDWNDCGPAALALYLRYYGWEGTQYDISEKLKPAREDRNVNVEELAYYIRTHAGWLNVQYRVGGTLTHLKAFLAAGMPVMIEESFHFDGGYWPNDDLWGAHYQLLTGYDDARSIFIGQDTYYGPNQEIPAGDLDHKWQTFNRVLIILYPPDREKTVQAILGPDWDVDENRRRALQTSEQEFKAAPRNAYAAFNTGTNLVYFERYAEAARAYDAARTIGLPQRMLRYQFGPFIAYFHAGRTDDLLAICDYALKITPNSEEALLWKGWGLYRKGKINDARTYFLQALDANKDYLDAKYALDFISRE